MHNLSLPVCQNYWLYNLLWEASVLRRCTKFSPISSPLWEYVSLISTFPAPLSQTDEGVVPSGFALLSTQASMYLDSPTQVLLWGCRLRGDSWSTGRSCLPLVSRPSFLRGPFSLGLLEFHSVIVSNCLEVTFQWRSKSILLEIPKQSINVLECIET